MTTSRRKPILPNKPTITHIETVAKTRLFHVEKVNLRFDNGNQVEYERLRSPSGGAVLIIPMLNEDTILMVREYVAGMDRYEIGFPKGVVDPEESAQEAAGRELKEEIGYGAHRMKTLRVVSVAPGYSNYQTHIVLATDLYPEKLPGDEPEEIEVIPWSLKELDKLFDRDDFVEARSIAALYLLQREV